MKKVEVVWVDSIGAGGWYTVPDGEFDRFADQPMICRSAGYLVRKKKDRVVLALNIGISGTNRGHLIVIPRAAIQKIRRLR
jgi:hypothetical protein